jgi:hypothetical protein
MRRLLEEVAMAKYTIFSSPKSISLLRICYELAKWLHEKRAVAQLLSKFRAFYKTRVFTAVLNNSPTLVPVLSQINQTYFTKINFNIILPLHLHLSGDLFHIKITMTFVFLQCML